MTYIISYDINFIKQTLSLIILLYVGKIVNIESHYPVTRIPTFYKERWHLKYLKQLRL